MKGECYNMYILWDIKIGAEGMRYVSWCRVMLIADRSYLLPRVVVLGLCCACDTTSFLGLK